MAMQFTRLASAAALLVVLGAGAQAQTADEMLSKLRGQAADNALIGGGAAGEGTRGGGVRINGALVGQSQTPAQGVQVQAEAPPESAPAAGGAASPAQVQRVAATPADRLPPVVREENRLDLYVTFETNSAFIRPSAAGLLENLCTALRSMPEANTFNIIGHADASGSAEVNERLSAARAREVSRHLERNCGIPAARLQVYGLGNRQLLPDVPPVSERNRRVEVSLNPMS